MKNMSKIKYVNWLICAIVALALTLSCIGFTVDRSYADETSKTPTRSSVSISGNQFDSSGSNIVKSPSGWTGSFIDNYSGSVVAGVVDLNENVELDKFTEATKLDKYSEFQKKMPTTPFGKNTSDPDSNYYAPGTNSKVLLINVYDEMGSAYGYRSNEITLDPDSYYVFSAWIKTGSFVQNEGAVIKLAGLPFDVGFWNIDNSADMDDPNNEWLGFSEYRIYVATAHISASVTLNLQVGDSYIYGESGKDDYAPHVYPSSGYALFDNVTCYKIPANDFYHETVKNTSDKITVADFNISANAKPGNQPKLSDYLLESEKSGVIGSFKNGLKGWTIVHKEGESSGQYLFADTYDASKPFDDENIIGLSSEPYTPNGNSDFMFEEMGDSNIAVLSAQTKASVGLESDEFEIERNAFYRLSVYAATQNFEDGNASIRLIGGNNGEKEVEPSIISSVNGSDSINNRYGWKRYYFFINGSKIQNYNLKLQLWLGFTSASTGTVLFDDIRLEKIPYSYFSANSSNGTIVTLDTAPNTSIDNGRFFDAEDYDAEFPLKPSQWASIGEVPENAASGMILTDDEHYSANASRYLGAKNPVSQFKNTNYNTYKYPSMLLLTSKDNGYFGYSSPDISITNNTSYKITVTMHTEDMGGAGANLWVEVDNKIISSIKNIGSHSGFNKYEFYIEGDTPFSSGTGVDYTAKLNIALGNQNAKASGSIFVAEAAVETITSDAFTEKYNQFKNERGEQLNYDMYSFSSLNFFAYDNTDKNAIKTSSNWSITNSASDSQGKYTYGVFDPLSKDQNVGDAYIPSEITKIYKNLPNKFENVFTLQTRDTSATAQLINPLKLGADSYYLITVTMAVILNDGNESKAIGAGLSLTGDYADVKFENIRTTSDDINTYKFVDYQFYVATSNTDSNVYLCVSLGGNNVHSAVDGEVYIAYIACTALGGADDTKVESETLKIINKHVDDETENPDNTEDNDDEETTTQVGTDSEKWWLIPSILFGIAILIAVVGSIIRSVLDKKSRKQRAKELNSYDRRLGYVDEDTDETVKFDDNVADQKPMIEQDVESFNDDEPIQQKEVAKATSEKKAKQKEEAPIDDFDD